MLRKQVYWYVSDHLCFCECAIVKIYLVTYTLRTSLECFHPKFVGRKVIALVTYSTCYAIVVTKLL